MRLTFALAGIVAATAATLFLMAPNLAAFVTAIAERQDWRYPLEMMMLGILIVIGGMATFYECRIGLDRDGPLLAMLVAGPFLVASAYWAYWAFVAPDMRIVAGVLAAVALFVGIGQAFIERDHFPKTT